MPFYFSESVFMGELSYPLELLQARQVVTFVVDYVIQELQLKANIFPQFCPPSSLFLKKREEH